MSWGLPAGRCVLTVEQPGFRLYRQSGITFRLADGTALDVKLDVGLPSQSVEVTATAPLLQNSQRRGQPERRGKENLHAANGRWPGTNEYIYDCVSVLQPEPGQVLCYPVIDGMAEFKLSVKRLLAPSTAGPTAARSW